MKNKNTLRFGVLAGIIGLATLTRVILPPVLGHPSNFAPIGALALFSGCYFNSRFLKFFVPLFALWFGDLFVDYLATGKFMLFYQGFYWQYACYVIFAFMGMALTNKVKPLNVVGSSLVASTLFFLITNFGVWAGGMIGYPHTLAGLSTCYIAAVPFFGNTLAGDLFYSAAMFGLFELAQRRFTSLSLKPVKA
jgi:hypothetical protein